MTVTYTPINAVTDNTGPVHHGAELVKLSADVLFALGVNDRESVRAGLDAMHNAINRVRDSIDDLELVDEEAAGILPE